MISGTNVNFDSTYEYDAAFGEIYESNPVGYVGQTTPVGIYAPNPWGLYDMCGNVSQWCKDWMGIYPTGSFSDPVGPGIGDYRMLRGGSWNSHGRDCRSASRLPLVPYSHGPSLGFRTVLAPGLP